MYIKDDYGFEDLKKAVWQGAKNTVKKVEEAGKEEQFMEFLEDMYAEEVPTLSQVNDYLWHDHTVVMEYMGIGEDEE